MTPEKREAAIRWLTDEIRSLRMAPSINGCGPENWAEQLEVMQTCLEAVKGHVVDTDKMVPLTLEQLRGMGGKPYWHVGLQDGSPEPHWKILDPFVARCPEDYGYGERWLAYAYPPAHIDREAWAEKQKLCEDADHLKDLLKEAEARAEKAESERDAAVNALEKLMKSVDSQYCCLMCAHDHTHTGPCSGQSTKCEPRWIWKKEE